MSIIKFAGPIISIITVLLVGSPVSAQDYPTKPIRIITGAPGSGNDLLARVIAQGISTPLGQPVIVDNRPTALIGEMVAKAPPDGYTLLLNGSSHWVQPLLQSVPYDPVRDFSPITLTERSPYLLVVHPSLPVKSVKDLIALAKSKPGELNYASASAATQLAAELFNSLAGVKIVYIPYKTLGVALNELLGGQVLVIFVGPVAVPHIESGKLRALAVTTAQPSAQFPTLPTMAATVPGYEVAAMGAIFAPGKTPVAVVNRLNQEIGRFLKTPGAKESFLKVGAEAATSSPEELAAEVRADMARLGKVIKDAGIKVN